MRSATTRPMETARFGGGLDNVGGAMLASLLAQTAPYGNVASAGLAGLARSCDATVMPFIIRGVSLLGVASAGTARDIRDEVWRRLAQRLEAGAPGRASARAKSAWTELPGVFATMLAGGSFGRTLVAPVTKSARCGLPRGRARLQSPQTPGNPHGSHPDRRRFALPADGHPPHRRKTRPRGAHRRRRRRRRGSRQARAARPDPDGRGDAEPQRVPGHALDHARGRPPSTSRSCW